MRTFKLILRSMFVGLTGLFILGCNLPSPSSRESEKATANTSKDSSSATFNIEAVPGRSSALESAREDLFGLPTSKSFNFYACLKDIYYNKPITGHAFKIEGIDANATSDSSGCISWSENISYNYLGDSKYLKLTRHITGMGIQKGTRSVSFAINPWSHGENLAAVVDVKNEGSIPNLVKSESDSSSALKGLSKDGNLKTRSLWLDEGRLFVTEKQMTTKGADLMIELRGSPSIQLSKMSGDLWLRPLTEGTFKVRLKIIHSYIEAGTEIHRLLNQSELLDAKMESGSLAVRSLLTMTAIPTRGQLILGLELEPAHAPQGLTAFSGIYVLGDYDQLKGTSFLKLATEVVQDKNFKVDSYINAKQDLISQNTDTYQKPKIEVAPLEFKFIKVGAEKTSERQVVFNVKACLRNGMDQKSSRAQTFKISKFRANLVASENALRVQTDNNSCVNWDETIEFKYFDCQHFLKGYVQIENADLGMNQKLEILVNPWDTFSSIGRDLRYVDPTEKLSLNCSHESRPKTRLTMDSFSYNTISYKYEVDDLLRLNVLKKIQLKIDPRTVAYSSLSAGRSESEKLRDGVYLLKLAIVRNRDYDQSNTYVTSAEKIVNVINGQINTDITFKAHDLKALGNRNNLLVELYPADESKLLITNSAIHLQQPEKGMDFIIAQDSGLESPTFIGPIILNLDESARSLRILDEAAISSLLIQNQSIKNSRSGLVGQIIAEGKLAEKANHESQRLHAENAQFTADHNLSFIDLNKLNDHTDLSLALKLNSAQTRINLKKSELMSLQSSSQIQKDLATKLCNFWTVEFLPSQFANKGGSISRSGKSGFYNDCLQAAAKNPSTFFLIDRRLKVKEVGETKYLKGFNQGLTVGTNFSLSRSDSENFNTTKSVSVSAKLGLGKLFLDMVSLDTGANMSASWTTSESNSTSSSISVGAASTIVVQTSRLKVTLKQYEKCTQIKLNPLLFKKDDHWFGRKDYFSILNNRLSDEEKLQAMTHGLMICDGQTNNQPLDVNETYYLLTQESNISQMQDAGDERNRNFFVSLRSENDFNRFVAAIKGQTKMPGTADNEILHKDVNDFMDKIFNMKDPATPGMFSLPAGL